MAEFWEVHDDLPEAVSTITRPASVATHAPSGPASTSRDTARYYSSTRQRPFSCRPRGAAASQRLCSFHSVTRVVRITSMSADSYHSSTS